jgi:hypothetical protein
MLRASRNNDCVSIKKINIIPEVPEYTEYAIQLHDHVSRNLLLYSVPKCLKIKKKISPRATSAK